MSGTVDPNGAGVLVIPSGGSITASQITDATASGRSMLTGGTAAGANLATAADTAAQAVLVSTGRLTTPTDASTGWTFSAGDRGGAASATQGSNLVTIVCASGVISEYDATSGFHAPSALRALPSRSWRSEMRAAVVSSGSAGSTTRCSMIVGDGTTQYAIQVFGDGTVETFKAGPITAGGRASSAGVLPTGGTGWLAMEYNAGAQRLCMYYGTGSGTTRPSDLSWTAFSFIEYASASAPLQPPTQLKLVGATYAAPVTPATFSMALRVYDLSL